MSQLSNSPFLRNVLLADAATSAAAGAVMAFGGGGLQSLLQLPGVLLVPAGVGLFGYAALLMWMARRDRMPRGLLWAVIVCNVAWAIDCLVLAFGPLFTPSGIGQAFLMMQVVTVLVFAELQFIAVRRGATTRAAA